MPMSWRKCIESLTNLPTLNASEHADADADRALAESGRHALDGAAGGPLPLPRPNVAAIREFVSRPAMMLRRPLVREMALA